MSIKVYTAGAMTGLSGAELVERSQNAAITLVEHGIYPLDPVLAEGVDPRAPVVQATYEQMVDFWKRDKAMIREAHVIIDLTPERKSEGVAHEIGYARYCLWKPVVRVYMNGKKPCLASVAFFEDDLIVDTLEEAAVEINRLWGTWFKRARWRMRLYNRCLLKACWYKLMEWK